MVEHFVNEILNVASPKISKEKNQNRESVLILK